MLSYGSPFSCSHSRHRGFLDSLYLATPKSKRVDLMHPCHLVFLLFMCWFVYSLYLATPKSKRGCVCCFPFPLCSLCVLLEHALKHYSPTCRHFAIVLERAQACFLDFSRCLCCAAVCGGFFANLAEQWRKIGEGGVSEIGKIDFSIVLLVCCVVFLFFLFISLARARQEVIEFDKEEQALMKKHCLQCTIKNRMKGDLVRCKEITKADHTERVTSDSESSLPLLNVFPLTRSKAKSNLPSQKNDKETTLLYVDWTKMYEMYRMTGSLGLYTTN